MSLKRHPALQPLSRDHVIALFHAHQLMWLSTGRARFDAITTVNNFRKAWANEIIPHFGNEERLLPQLPIRAESISRLLTEHASIRQLISSMHDGEPDLDLCSRIGNAIERHVRWEEHELFPEVERSLSQPQLDELQEQTKPIDEARKHCNR